MRIAVRLLLLCLLLACGEADPVELTVMRDTTLPKPRFTVSAKEAPRSLSVERVPPVKKTGGGAVMWRLMRKPGDAVSLPLELEYSSVPTGYVAAAPAAFLTPGYYQLVAQAGGRRWVRDFEVSVDGRVTSGTPMRSGARGR